MKRLLLLGLCLFAAVMSPGAQSGGILVISQVYGGGGNSGATYRNDFIELYNRGSAPVDVNGWSVQYASAAGSSWAVTTLSGIIPPGRYYLVQQAAGAGGTTNLPTPDATGTIAMSATAGKVALVQGTAALTGTCPAAIDFVGYGGTATCFEGSGPTAAPSNTTAVLRNGAGAIDTNDNSADFTTGEPDPRNSLTVVGALAGTGAATPSAVVSGGTSLLTVAVTPAANPPAPTSPSRRT
jgi:predicted extracellular nuclease